MKLVSYEQGSNRAWHWIAEDDSWEARKMRPHGVTLSHWGTIKITLGDWNRGDWRASVLRGGEPGQTYDETGRVDAAPDNDRAMALEMIEQQMQAINDVELALNALEIDSVVRLFETADDSVMVKVPLGTLRRLGHCYPTNCTECFGSLCPSILL